MAESSSIDNVAANVRHYRAIKKRWRQSDLSKAAGVPRSNISQIENGRMTPTLDTIDKLAAAFGIPADKLLKSPR